MSREREGRAHKEKRTFFEMRKINLFGEDRIHHLQQALAREAKIAHQLLQLLPIRLRQNPLTCTRKEPEPKPCERALWI